MYEKFSGWSLLFAHYLKRDFGKIILWIVSIVLFSAGFVPAFKEIANGNGLIGMFETLQNPAMISMVGPTPIDVAKDYTIGAMYAHEMLLFCGLFAMIISMLHVIGHTRKEEELGLTELVRSFQIGRQANSLAVLVEIVLINGLIAIFTFVMMTIFNVETISLQGALLFGSTIGIAGIMGACIALVMAQVMPTSSSAVGTSLGIVGLLYIIRAGTDVSNIEWSKVNPLGWTYLTYPFTDNNWFYILIAFLFSIVIFVLAMILEGSRDMDSSYIPEKKGRANAKKSLLSIPGLLYKINKGTIISWLIAYLVMGMAYGSIYGDMQTFIESNEMIKQMFAHSNMSIESSFTSTIMVVMISLVAILPITIVNKLFSEESKLHLNQIYSTKVTRRKVYWSTIVLALLSSIFGVLVVTLSLGMTGINAMDQQSELDLKDFLFAGYNYLPAILIFTSIASIALGWAPKLGKLAYVYLGYAFAISYFGSSLNLPEWFSNTSILNLISQMPKENFDTMTFVLLSIVSIVFIVFGYVGYRNRDLKE